MTNIYSASVLLRWRDGSSTDFPITATNGCYSSINSFMDYCELVAKNNSRFSTADVTINAMECELLKDGTLNPVQKRDRVIRNGNFLSCV